jgi:hypothetical protein
MIQIEKGLPRRQLRIQNKIRFIVFLLLILLPVITFFIQRTGHTETKWTEYQVSEGEYYWNIAKQLQQAGYKSKTDIRKIVDELQEMSGIPAHELMEGDTIYIPDMEGLK